MDFGISGKKLSERINMLRKNWTSSIGMSNARTSINMEHFTIRMVPITDIVENLVKTAFEEDILPAGVTIKYELAQNQQSHFSIFFEKHGKKCARVSFTNSDHNPVILHATGTTSAPSFHNKQYNIANKQSLKDFRSDLEEWFVVMIAYNFNICALNPTFSSTIDPLEKLSSNTKSSSKKVSGRR